MEQIIEFLSQNKYGNLATCVGNQPDTRPMELVFHSDKRMYFYTSIGEDLASQLRDNPNISFTSTDQNYNYVKLRGSVEFSKEKQDKLKILENSTFANRVFNDSNLDSMLVFYLPHGKAMMHIHGENKPITSDF